MAFTGVKYMRYSLLGYMIASGLKEYLKQHNIAVSDHAEFYGYQSAASYLSQEESQNIISGSRAIVHEILYGEELKEEVYDLFSPKESSGGRRRMYENRDILLCSPQKDYELAIAIPQAERIIRRIMISRGNKYGLSYYGESSDAYREKCEEILSSDNIRDRESVYEPLLDAMAEELKKICDKDRDAPGRFIKYIMGAHDCYYVLPSLKKHVATIYDYNFKKPKYKANPILPERLLDARRKIYGGEISKTTLSLLFDTGWMFEIRLHFNKFGKKASPILDIRPVVFPAGIAQQQAQWIP